MTILNIVESYSMIRKIKQNNFEIQKFKEANTPELSYTLQLGQRKPNADSFTKTEETVLHNKKTNAEFSVSAHKKEYGYDIIEIKRVIKKVKN